MRAMELPPFSQTTEIINLEELYRTRLNQRNNLRATVAIPLLGYMGWPNDQVAREEAMKTLQDWVHKDEKGPVPKHIVAIHLNWARVADVLNLHCDLSHGGHQEKRGGASVGKAIFLLSKTATSWGTGQANLWKSWEAYKDVAHLISAAILICADIYERNKRTTLGVELQQLLPLRVVLAFPELVLAVGLAYQEYGLNFLAKGGTEPIFDPQTLWRIPADIKVSPIQPPVRKIREQDLQVLRARRAGNRGLRKRKLIPVS